MSEQEQKSSQNNEDTNTSEMPNPGDANKAKPDSLEHWKAEADKFKNEYLYLLAEFENYKKGVIKERSDLRKYGSERLIVDLLKGVDLLEHALLSKITPENLESFRKGIELTLGEFKSVLQRFGVVELPAHGAAFDPNHHEALSSEETTSVPEGHITQVYRKPYKLHERVIRPAQVVVAKTPSSGENKN